MMQELGYSLAGLVVGFAIGATGIGGGSLMTPMLILFYGVSPALAVGTDLLFASVSKAFAVTLHGRNGSVDWHLVGWQTLGSVPAVFLTLWALQGYTDPAGLSHLIKLVLSGAIILTATFMLFQEPLLRCLRDRPESERWLTEPRRRLLTVVAGVVIGVVVTISSVGAGVIGLMLLMLLYPRREIVNIVGSDLAHAVLVTAIAGLGHAKLGTVDYSMLGALLLGSFPGVWLGSKLGFRMSNVAMKRSIAGLLIFVGATTLAKAAISG